MGRDDPRMPEPDEALLRAAESLTRGHFDSRHGAGAQVNALESIAWSLMGLLRNHIDSDGDGPSEELSAALKNAGMMQMEDMR